MTAASIRPSSSSGSASTAEWMQNLNLVFKNFDESFLKSPLFYGGTPHVVPEKITESFIDPSNNGRLYRVKWLDTWISEHIAVSAFPHLIAEYWINKQMLNESLDFQNNSPTIDSTNNQTTAKATLPQMIINNLNANDLTKDQRQDTNTNNINQSSVASTQSLNLPLQFFQNSVSKQTFRSHDNTHATNKSVDSDFTVDHSIPLQQKLSTKDLKDAKKSAVHDSISSQLPAQNEVSGAKEIQIQSSVPTPNKSNEQPVVMYFEKPLNYATNLSQEEKTKIQLSNGKIQAHNFSNTNPDIVQHTISFPSMTQIQEMDQVAAQMQQMPIQSTIQKKSASAKKAQSTTKPPKQPTAARKTANIYKNPVQCDICFKTISSKKNLRIHKTVKHFKNGSFSCHICGRNFALNRDLQRHMPLHTNERNYVCQYCGLQCKQPGHLTKHIRTHTEVMNWRCDVCFKNFRVQSDLKAHCFNDHKDITLKNLNCSVCKEKLKLPNSVYLHSLRHSGVREFECPICKATFKLKQHMQVHMKTHEKSNNRESHQCPICMKVFRSKVLCLKHTEKHEEKTPKEFQGKVKEKESRVKGGRRSMKVIEAKEENGETIINEQPEEDKVTKRKQKLPSKIFENNVTGKKKRINNEDFDCHICSESFDTKHALLCHTETLHGEQSVLTAFDTTTETVTNNADSAPMNQNNEILPPDDDDRTDLRLPEFRVSTVNAASTVNNGCLTNEVNDADVSVVDV